ncbi:MAG: esterase [Burkholderiales bacterium]|nr:esterase [Burkholderiales bacterium]
MNILYLHGFRSSPQSMKARLMAAHFATTEHRFVCPQLPASPAAAMELACEFIEDRGEPACDWALIGSSLGGYYATWLAERYGCRAALLNPAVLPADDLAGYVGEQTLYHSSEPFEWRAEYLHELQALRIDPITHPERYLLLAATGDEVLDWRRMCEHYPGAQQHIIDGSDHAISEFSAYVELVARFVADDE